MFPKPSKTKKAKQYADGKEEPKESKIEIEKKRSQLGAHIRGILDERNTYDRDFRKFLGPKLKEFEEVSDNLFSLTPSEIDKALKNLNQTKDKFKKETKKSEAKETRARNKENKNRDQERQKLIKQETQAQKARYKARKKKIIDLVNQKMEMEGGYNWEQNSDRILKCLDS